MQPGMVLSFLTVDNLLHQDWYLIFLNCGQTVWTGSLFSNSGQPTVLDWLLVFLNCGQSIWTKSLFSNSGQPALPGLV